MARMTFQASEDYASRLSKLAAHTDGIAKKAIFRGADILADEIRANLHGILSPDATGDLENALGITPIERDAQGNWNAKIGFDGYDRNGTPNQLKARVLESGTTKHKKHGFVRKAVNAKKQAAIAEMGKVIETEIKEQMG